MLARLGARAEKGPRMTARIGLGLSKKRGERESRALAEAIAAGMAKAKGRGKARRAEAAAARDPGLMELGKGWRGGLLRMKAPPKR
jgi:hypothetical protein